MPVAVACPKCQKKYTLPDNLLGKPVKCTACQAQFQTPVRGAGGQPTAAQTRAATAASAAQAAVQQRARALAQKNAEELQRLGVGGLIQRAPDVFSGSVSMQGTPDPLANHLIEDPGFGDLATAISAVEAGAKPDDPLAAMFANPALEKSKKRKPAFTGKRKQNLGPWNSQPWFLLLATFCPLFAVSIGLSWFELLPEGTNRIVAAAVCGIFCLFGLLVGIWGLRTVHETTPGPVQVLLCLLIPGYIIYYIIVHWEPMRSYAFALLAMAAASPLAVAALVLSGVSMEI